MLFGVWPKLSQMLVSLRITWSHDLFFFFFSLLFHLYFCYRACPMSAVNIAVPDSANAAWYKLLQAPKHEGTYVEGYVEGREALIFFLETFSRSTQTSFSTRQSDQVGAAEKTAITSTLLRRQVLWQKVTGKIRIPFDGTPFTVCGRTVIMECQHGPARQKNRPKVPFCSHLLSLSPSLLFQENHTQINKVWLFLTLQRQQ